MQSASFQGSTRGVSSAFLFLFLSGLTGHAHAVQYRVSAPAEVSRILPVEAGGSASFVIDVENTEPQAGVAAVTALMTESGSTISGYTIGLGQPAQCGTPTSSATADGKLLSFPVSLGAWQTLRCSYPLSRENTSRDDLRLRFCVPTSFSCLGILSYAAGTLPDLRMASEIAWVPYGTSEAIVRVSQHNPSSRAIAAHVTETFCTMHPIGSPPDSIGPFALEADFPGACPGLTTSTCGDGFMGITGTNHQFMLGPIPANGEASCLLRLRFRGPLTAPAAMGLVGGPPPVQFVDGGTGFDLSALNDQTVFGAAPAAAAVPLLDWAGLSGLTSLLMALAAISLRRRLRYH